MAKFSVLRASLLVMLVFAALSVSRGQSNLQRSQMAANEASAVGVLRTLSTACITYQSTYRSLPTQLADLGPGNPPSASHAGLIDAVLASGKRSGYVFTYMRGTVNLPDGRTVPSFSFYADPITENTTGIRHFFMDQRGTIYSGLQ
jgi:type IV pilus assembly protein PilA